MEKFPTPGAAQEEKEQNPETCAHGVGRGSVCQACVQESLAEQPIWNKIAEWRKDSKYTRSDEHNPACTIERENIKLTISMVDAEDAETLAQIQKIMIETFGEDEVDPQDIMVAGIKGERAPRGRSDGGPGDVARYRIFVGKDEKGEIQSLYQSGLIDIEENGKPTGEKVLMGAYGVTRKGNEGKGMVREMYISSMMQAAADAHAEGKKFTMIAGECTPASERAWGAMGRRRVYVQTGPKEYTELKYVQPALDYNEDTGLGIDPETEEAREGAGESPEHIMVQFVEGTPSKERVSAAVDSMYRWCNLWKKNEFNNDEAFDVHKSYIDKVKKEFDDLLTNSGEMRLLSPQDRDMLRVEGITIREYTEADGKEEDGPENA